VGTLSRTVLLFLVPHLPYMVLHDGGPQPQWVGSPDQGAESRAQLAHPLGQLVEINTNTCMTIDSFWLRTVGADCRRKCMHVHRATMQSFGNQAKAHACMSLCCSSPIMKKLCCHPRLPQDTYASMHRSHRRVPALPMQSGER
jgi:hypothetical protein